MHLRAQNFVLGLAALVCFVDAFVAKGDDPGPAITAVLGILLVRRALVISPQSPLVIIAGCMLTALVLAGNHSLVNINGPLWIVLALVGFAFFGWWERIVKLRRKVS
jgi:hypothetical protein